MSRGRNRKKQINLLPRPQKQLPAHSSQTQSQPFIGPPPPKNYKEQNCLPGAWTQNHEKLHKLLQNKTVGELIVLLKKFLRIRDGGYQEAPKEFTDTHIDVAKYILEKNYGKKI